MTRARVELLQGDSRGNMSESLRREECWKGFVVLDSRKRRLVSAKIFPSVMAEYKADHDNVGLQRVVSTQ